MRAPLSGAPSNHRACADLRVCEQSREMFEGVPAARRGHRGMPSRISPRPAPTSGRRPSMAGSGHPPAATAGPEPSSRPEEVNGEERQAVVVIDDFRMPPLSTSIPELPNPQRGRLQATPPAPLLISVPDPADARSRRVHRGVCGQPAMDGRRPAVVAGRGLRPGEHTPRCTRRAARITTKRPPAAPIASGRPGIRRAPPVLRYLRSSPGALSRVET